MENPHGSNAAVDILLATYHGAAFLDAQLESIANQTFQGWQITARDDGSHDDTVSILARWQARLGGRLTIVSDSRSNLGAAQNFATLLRVSSRPYVAFCDQDDVWFPTKLDDSLRLIRSLETIHGRHTPLLVHSDLEVVDQDLTTVASSFWAHQFVIPQNDTELRRLLVQNVVTGCTTLINRSLADLVSPIPCGVIMHDWWIALVGAAFGNVAHLDHATVRYRQHTGNDTGAKHWGPTYVAGQLTQVLRPTSKAADSLRATQTQAACLLEAFGDRLTAQQRELVSDYASLSQRTPLQRRVSLVQHGIFKTGAARNIGLFLSI